MVFSLLPVYLADELAIGHTQIGLIEGVAVASSFAAKFFSGLLSDVQKKRKPLIMLGTILSALTKPLFAICSGASAIFFLRLADRLSKGIRSAPTDALIADLSESHLYASNYGIRQALYTLGACGGGVLAMGIMLWSDNNYRLVFWLSLLPALLAVGILHFLVKPKAQTHPRHDQKFQTKILISDFGKFSPAFWWLLVAIFFLMMSRFSEAFLTLKAKQSGFSIAFLPAVIILMDIVHSVVAMPAGRFADQISRTKMLGLGLLVAMTAQLLVAWSDSSLAMLLGILLVGLHLGITQGLIKALIAQSTPAELRGCAFSLYFAVSAVALFLGNLIAGHLSETFGMGATFLGGALFTGVSLLVLLLTNLLNKPALEKMPRPA